MWEDWGQLRWRGHRRWHQSKSREGSDCTWQSSCCYQWWFWKMEQKILDREWLSEEDAHDKAVTSSIQARARVRGKMFVRSLMGVLWSSERISLCVMQSFTPARETETRRWQECKVNSFSFFLSFFFVLHWTVIWSRASVLIRKGRLSTDNYVNMLTR